MTVVTWIASLMFWGAVCMIAGVKEPWDAKCYWSVIYPAALALSALLGLTRREAGWAAGAIVIFAQVPVVVAMSGIGPLLAVGVLYAALLALPAAALSWLASMARRRFEQHRHARSR